MAGLFLAWCLLRLCDSMCTDWRPITDHLWQEVEQTNTLLLILFPYPLKSPSPPQWDGGTQDKWLPPHKDASVASWRSQHMFLRRCPASWRRVGILWVEQKNGPIWQGKVIHVCDCSPGSMFGKRRGVDEFMASGWPGTVWPQPQLNSLPVCFSRWEEQWHQLTQENKRQRKETQPLLPTCILNLSISFSWVLDFGEIHSSSPPPPGLRHKRGDIFVSAGHPDGRQQIMGLFNIYLFIYNNYNLFIYDISLHNDYHKNPHNKSLFLVLEIPEWFRETG